MFTNFFRDFSKMQQHSGAFRSRLEGLRDRYQFRRTLHAPRCFLFWLAAALLSAISESVPGLAALDGERRSQVTHLDGMIRSFQRPKDWGGRLGEKITTEKVS